MAKINKNYVEEGFDILHVVLLDYVVEKFKEVYRSNWWNEILNTVDDTYGNLPLTITDEELKVKLDLQKLLKIFTNGWWNVFKSDFRGDNADVCKNLAFELVQVRNLTQGHIGVNDISQEDAERDLDTMVRFCRYLDQDEAEKINAIYVEVKNNGYQNMLNSGPVPFDVKTDVDKVKYTPGEKLNLLEMIGTDLVMQTSGTHPLVFDGKTDNYSVFYVNLKALYYNEQNGRIASWINQYIAENGEDSFKKIVNKDRDAYNDLIENFIYESNPTAIENTEKNIEAFTQRVPGVILPDGRVVDGNRRFTCLRRLQKKSTEPLYFKAVIPDLDIDRDIKKIKKLELSIQFGEEEKTKYPSEDEAIETYMTIEQDKILSIEEYAKDANQSVSDVKGKIVVAKLMIEFLNYVKLPNKFNVAKEYEVYDLFNEMNKKLKKLSPEDKEALKIVTFNFVLLKVLKDQRRIMRTDISNIINGDNYKEFFKEQLRISESIHEQFDARVINSKADLDAFAEENEVFREKLKLSLENALKALRRKQVKSKPIDNVAKSVSNMVEIDEQIIDKMNDKEKADFIDKVTSLEKIAGQYKAMATGDEVQAAKPDIAIDAANMPLLICKDTGKAISAESNTLSFSIIKENDLQKDNCSVRLYFTDIRYHRISNICRCELRTDEETLCEFNFEELQEGEDKVLLIVQPEAAVDNQALRIIPFNISK